METSVPVVDGFFFQDGRPEPTPGLRKTKNRKATTQEISFAAVAQPATQQMGAANDKVLNKDGGENGDEDKNASYGDKNDCKDAAGCSDQNASKSAVAVSAKYGLKKDPSRTVDESGDEEFVDTIIDKKVWESLEKAFPHIVPYELAKKSYLLKVAYGRMEKWHRLDYSTETQNKLTYPDGYYAIALDVGISACLDAKKGLDRIRPHHLDPRKEGFEHYGDVVVGCLRDFGAQSVAKDSGGHSLSVLNLHGKPMDYELSRLYPDKGISENFVSPSPRIIESSDPSPPSEKETL